MSTTDRRIRTDGVMVGMGSSIRSYHEGPGRKHYTEGDWNEEEGALGSYVCWAPWKQRIDKELGERRCQRIIGAEDQARGREEGAGGDCGCQREGDEQKTRDDWKPGP